MRLEFKWKCLAAIVAVFIFGLFQVGVFAQVTSSIKFSYVGTGIEFKLYRIGEISSQREVEITGNFKGYSVSLQDKTAAQTLAAYALRDDISPDATSITNNEYNAVFNGLNRGVYLITGDSYTSGNKKYTALPVIVSVLNDKDNSDILVNGKYEVKTISTPGGGGTPPDGTIDVSVLKVWKGSNVKSDVTVQLLRDGIVYNEVILNSANNWRNTWKSLSDSYNWMVVEKKVAEGYEVGIERDGSVFIITNTYIPTIPEEPDNPNKENTTETSTIYEEPETSEEPGVTETVVTPDTPKEPDSHDTSRDLGDEPDSDDSDEPNSGNKSAVLGSPKGDQTPPDDEEGNVGSKINRPNKPADVPVSGNEKLPQTGQLWWPVPVLAGIGVLLIIIGMSYRREGEC